MATEKPKVARIIIEVLLNRADSLPTDLIVEGLSEDGIPVLSSTVETIKGKNLNGKLLKRAKSALAELIENDGEV